MFGFKMQCFSSFDCRTQPKIQCGPLSLERFELFSLFPLSKMSTVGHHVGKHLKLHKALTYLNGVVCHKRAPHVSLAKLFHQEEHSHTGALPPASLGPLGPFTSQMRPTLLPALPNPPVLGRHESVLTVATGGATVEAYISSKSTKQYGQTGM